jgi:hypothetical protein
MKNISKQEFLDNIEKNLKRFNSLLAPLKQKERSDIPMKEAELKSFFSTLVAVEEDVIEMRLKKIIKEEHPYLPAINVGKLQQHNFYYQETLNSLIDKFLKQRFQLFSFLQEIPYYEWERTGFHELEGHVSFEEFIKRIIKNDQKNITMLQSDLMAKKRKN